MKSMLCKFRGMLVIMEVSELADGAETQCPDCGGKQFTENNGWIECDNCSFAVDKKSYEKFLKITNNIKD